MNAPHLDRIAAWEPGPVRTGVAQLASVAERLPGWRVRLEAIGRELQAAPCWSGPAAESAARVVVHLSTAATAVSDAWDGSLAALHLLVGQVQTAQELAGEARSCAVSIGRELTPVGALDLPVAPVVPTMAADQREVVAEHMAVAARDTALAAEALHHGALAAAAAQEAGEALRAVGVVGPRAPADFAGLVAAVGPPRTTSVPLPGAPPAVAAWWAGLSAAAQAAVVAADPGRIGGLDGVPAWARDRANRILLARALDTAAPTCGHRTALAVAARLADEEAAGRPVQLYAFDPAAGLAAVALGDLDSADAVGVLVPGMGTTVVDDLEPLLTSAENVAEAARAAVPGLAVATLAWIGYQAPRNLLEATRRGLARRGALALAGDLAGLAGSRAATGHPDSRTTVLAHSYGTVLLDQAADRPGRLATDAVVLLGSPGMERDGDLRREAAEVYDAVGGLDPVAVSGWFGEQPWRPEYGATLLPTDLHETHGSYYDPGQPTLAALGAVVAGTRRRR